MPYSIPKCQIVPEADSQVSFQVDGAERLRYHFAERYSRPFFYPVIGPSGRSVTRMGHPAAPDHDHHRSLWFANNDVAGNNFWAEGQAPRIVQRHWVHYQDGDQEAALVVDLDWVDGHAVTLMTQRLVTALRPLEGGESLIELQSDFSTKLDPLPLNKTNFGFLAVRMAKSISHHYGGGELRNSEGAVGEPAIFGRPARWVDYSGPIVGARSEGITYLPHPSNPNHPSSWHVRDDGWMSAAFCLREGFDLTPKQPLTLRYLLHVHAGPCDPASADRVFDRFAETPRYVVEPVPRGSQWRVRLRRATA